MDLVISLFSLLAALSTVALTVIGISGMIRHHKIMGLWLAYVTVIFALTVFVLNWHKELSADAAKIIPPELASLKISVDIGNTTDAKSPFQTRFILTNNNPESIFKVNVTGEAWNAQTGVTPFMVADVDFIPELPPTKRFSLNPGNLSIGFLMTPKLPETMLMQLRVKYVYKGAEVTTDFRFTASRTKEGAYVWFPTDPAKGLDEVLREISLRSPQAPEAKQ